MEDDNLYHVVSGIAFNGCIDESGFCSVMFMRIGGAVTGVDYYAYLGSLNLVIHGVILPPNLMIRISVDTTVTTPPLAP